MKKNVMDQQHAWLLRKFHALCAEAGISADEKQAIISGYGVESSADIGNHELIDLCHTIETRINPQYKETDKLRKRLMAAIGGWLKKTGQPSNAEYIKAIACQASGFREFNKIPKERLNSLYHAFCNRQKDHTNVKTFMKDQENYLSNLN